jgi:cytochrome bd ubiquinol oxidase subunit I
VFGMGVYYMLKMLKRGPEESIELSQSRRHPVLRNRPLDALEGE